MPSCSRKSEVDPQLKRILSENSNQDLLCMIILFYWGTFLDFHQEAMLTDGISLALVLYKPFYM